MMKNATAESDTPPERKNDMLGLRLDAMFDDQAFKNFLIAEIAAEKETFKTSKELLNYISARLAELISADPETLGFDPRAQFEAVGAYMRRVADNMEAYSADNKPNPAAVFWPDPTRGTGR
ncbi:MAG: hypothetical protein WD407_13745, partial [Rhodospirillales bacterium]